MDQWDIKQFDLNIPDTLLSALSLRGLGSFDETDTLPVAWDCNDLERIDSEVSIGSCNSNKMACD